MVAAVAAFGKQHPARIRGYTSTPGAFQKRLGGVSVKGWSSDFLTGRASVT